MVSERPEDLDVIGIAEDELEAAVQVFHVRRGRVVGRERLRSPTRWRTSPRPSWWPGWSSSSTGRRAPRCPAGSSFPACPSEPERAGGLAGRACGAGRSAGRAPSRGQAGPAGDGDPQRRRGPGPPPAAPGRRPQQPLAGPDRAAGRPGSAPGPPAHRVLRHEPPPGHRLRGLDGRLRGRAGQEVRLPAVRGEDRARQRRLRGHGGGADPPADGPGGRARPKGIGGERRRYR